MEEIEFQEDFRAFVRAAIPALRAVELLLLLRGQPERWWEPAVAAASEAEAEEMVATEPEWRLTAEQAEDAAAPARAERGATPIDVVTEPEPGQPRKRGWWNRLVR